MSAIALHSRPYLRRFLADDFSVLILDGMPAWILMRDGRLKRVH